MKWLDRLRHRDQEWDARTGSYVREGWVAERQALDDAEMRKWRERMDAGRPETRSTCLACGLMIDLHPHPERMYRSGPDLCQAAAKASAHIDGFEDTKAALVEYLTDPDNCITPPAHSESSSRLAGIDSPPERG